jgi:HSP20 family protein
MATNGKQAVATRKQRMADPFAWLEQSGLWPRARWLDAWPRFGFVRPAPLGDSKWIPDIDVFERDGKTIVRVDLPGMKREDLEVAVEQDMLVIHGHREEEKEVRREDCTYSERATGEFSRAISLPEGVLEDDIKAMYTDGVLEVVVPLPAEPAPKSKKIAVT